MAIIVKCTLMPAAPPRWDGDCIHCSFIGIPSGLPLLCPSCGYTVCAGHIGHHSISEDNEENHSVAERVLPLHDFITSTFS